MYFHRFALLEGTDAIFFGQFSQFVGDDLVYSKFVLANHIAIYAFLLGKIYLGTNLVSMNKLVFLHVCSHPGS